MKARSVNEAVNFTRTGDSKKSLNVGRYSPGELEAAGKEIQDKFRKAGVIVGWVKENPRETSALYNDTIFRIPIESILTSSGWKSNWNATRVRMHFSTNPANLIKIYDWDATDDLEINGPWIFINDVTEYSGVIVETYDDPAGLVEHFIKTEYGEVILDEDWLSVTKERIDILEK